MRRYKRYASMNKKRVIYASLMYRFQFLKNNRSRLQDLWEFEFVQHDTRR